MPAFQPAFCAAKRARRRRRGSAMMEMIFAMPFLLFVMILAMNFCKMYLAQQRAMVAARYVAWADVQHRALPPATEISTKFFLGESATVGAGQIDSGNAGFLPAAFASASGTKEYRVTYQYKPIYTGASTVTGKNLGLFPAIRINGTLDVDSGDWRYPDFSFKTIMGGIFDMIKNLF
jgi:Flp pilus assembly protein TadG